jgi:hypothetical protein
MKKMFIFIGLKFSIICKKIHKIKNWLFPKFLGCFAYWNQNHQLLNKNLKVVQFENEVSNFQFFCSFCILKTKIRGFGIGLI